MSIDENPANGILVSAKLLCCSSEDGTTYPKALRFAKSIAQHRENAAIDCLLGIGQRSNSRVRSLLMEAHVQDGGELLSHIGSRGRGHVASD